MSLNKVQVDPLASRLCHPVTEYSAPQGSSGFPKGPWPSMDPVDRLLYSRQGSSPIEEYVTQFCPESPVSQFSPGSSLCLGGLLFPRGGLMFRLFHRGGLLLHRGGLLFYSGGLLLHRGRLLFCSGGLLLCRGDLQTHLRCWWWSSASPVLPVPSWFSASPVLTQSQGHPSPHGPVPPSFPRFHLRSTTLLVFVVFGASGRGGLCHESVPWSFI
ncbi:uncharacterized protein LOC122145694 [Cyprinus carpio]|uniref:Uncharacterized protein LOC122145694 n=1 Tax=Cyprinus carpio TaxID=7962 RepID=A0A9R0B007_CYPCA|nr:uncharacterized protein LOC122145694 [Cyprinus carpio]